MTTVSTDKRAPVGPLRQWIMNHDDKWMFIVPYIALAVLLSVILSLFWLVVVVAVHFALEWLRQTYFAQMREENAGFLTLLKRTAWELKLDIGLVIFALALALYMEAVLGVVGLGAASRASRRASA